MRRLWIQLMTFHVQRKVPIIGFKIVLSVSILKLRFKRILRVVARRNWLRRSVISASTRIDDVVLTFHS